MNAPTAGFRRTRKNHWESFLGVAEAKDQWTVIRYTRPGRGHAIPTIGRERPSS